MPLPRHPWPPLVAAALALALAVTLRPEPALAFQCQAPPKVTLITGPLTLPTNGQLFLRTRLAPAKLDKLALVRVGSGRRVRTELVTGEGPTRLRPTRGLLPSRRYRLVLAGQELATFQTSTDAEPGLSPSLGEVFLRFSEPHLPDPNTPAKRALYRGRSATLVVGEPTPLRPAVVVVALRWEPADGKPVERTLLLPWAREIPIASLRPCTPISTPAPVQGTYAITATPWSASGHRGKPVTLIGSVQ